MPDSLPVLFFGDFATARAATVGLNPSNQEYTTRDGELLTGPKQRFATLSSLGAVSRSKLSPQQCDEAIEWMRGYFGDGKPAYRWFGHLRRFLEGAGYSFGAGTAAHLDLVQESTFPVWGDLGPAARAELLELDLPFLEWQLRSRPLEALFCNGRTVSDIIRRRLSVDVEKTGHLMRLRWWAGSAEVGGRRLPVAGWNYPLDRPTGLSGDGERSFGAMLARELELSP